MQSLNAVKLALKMAIKRSSIPADSGDHHCCSENSSEKDTK